MVEWTKRRFLQGMLGGGAVTIGLPLLNFTLDANGETLDSGAAIPTRFATWLWGCGINQARWVPDKTGRNFDFKAELKPLEPFREKVTVFSGFNCILNGQPNLPHWSGVMATLTGAAPTRGGMGSGSTDHPTIDTLIASAIGANNRFRSLEVACTGQPSVSYSMPAGSTVNPSEVDPVGLYRRIFGSGFADPNSATFTPDPKIMLRKSVLTAVKDERTELLRRVGAADRERLDQYFTSLRQMEQQLERQLEPPPPAEACVVPREPGELKLGPTWETAVKAHDMLTDLVVMALACNQTRVANIALSTLASNLRRRDEVISLHNLTHEEPIDAGLGFQPKSTFFLERSMDLLAGFLKKLDNVREGNGTLLDHSLVLATSESNYARLHTIDSLPMIVAGGAGGRWRSGQHIAGKGDPVSRVGLTLQQALGMSVDSWGAGALRTSNPITEVI